MDHHETKRQITSGKWFLKVDTTWYTFTAEQERVKLFLCRSSGKECWVGIHCCSFVLIMLLACIFNYPRLFFHVSVLLSYSTYSCAAATVPTLCLFVFLSSQILLLFALTLCAWQGGGVLIPLIHTCSQVSFIFSLKYYLWANKMIKKIYTIIAF